VINVDKNPAYPAAVEALKAEELLPRRVQLRECKYLNNVVEQDHRTVKKRVWLAKGYGSFATAWRTIQGIEAVNMLDQLSRAAVREGMVHHPIAVKAEG
jgi:transposase-like protein